jgi:hypothetical protein
MDCPNCDNIREREKKICNIPVTTVVIGGREEPPIVQDEWFHHLKIDE